MAIKQELHLTSLPSKLKTSLINNLLRDPHLMVICTMGDQRKDGLQTVYQPAIESGMLQYQMKQDVEIADVVSLFRLPSSLPYYQSLGTTIIRPDKSETETIIREAAKDRRKKIKLGWQKLRGGIYWHDAISLYNEVESGGENARELLIDEVLSADAITVFIPTENDSTPSS